VLVVSGNNKKISR